MRKAHVHKERAGQCANDDTNAETKEAIRCMAGFAGELDLRATHGSRPKRFSNPVAASACWTAIGIAQQPASTCTALQAVYPSQCC